MNSLWSVPSLDNAVVCDIETNGLDPTKVHYIVTRDLHTDEEEVWAGESVQKARHMLEGKTIVGHNFLAYDAPALRKLLGLTIPDSSIVDTLVLSRLFHAARKGGHSLDSYSDGALSKEGKDITDWSVPTPLMLLRCKSDVKLNKRMFLKQMKFLLQGEWKSSIELEHNVALLCMELQDTGLPFDKDTALHMLEEVQGKLEYLDKAIQRDFPPRAKLLKEVHPRTTKAGLLHTGDFRFEKGSLDKYTGGPFSRFVYEPFNPGSPVQVVQRMNEAGWKPTEKTDGHIKELRKRGRERDKERLAKFKSIGWKVSEKNLATLPHTAPPSAQSLQQRITLANRAASLTEWLSKVDKGRIHGRYTPIGAWTHRLAHSNPNTANIPSPFYAPKDSPEFQQYLSRLNGRMRGLFIAPKGWRMVGTDADGIQMRVFAHLIKSPELVKAITEGRKEDKTDIHNLHKSYLGDLCLTRDIAKTFIYAWLLGAGTGKVAEILGCAMKQAKEAEQEFLSNYPGLKHLKEVVIPADAKRGYFIGLDGRKVILKHERLGLSGYLQNGEKVIMAKALVQWKQEFQEGGIKHQLINWVHDEWQTLVPDDDALVAQAQEIQIRSIRDQGTALDMFCPRDGSSDSGYSWLDTH